MIHSRVERARPLLGTVVKISIQGLPEAEANSAINNGFAVISKVHGLMSFHEGASELSQLNRSGYKKSIEVHPYTFDVLRRTVDLAADTHGVFDPTIAGHLVEWGLLPSPEISEEIVTVDALYASLEDPAERPTKKKRTSKKKSVKKTSEKVAPKKKRAARSPAKKKTV